MVQQETKNNNSLGWFSAGAFRRVQQRAAPAKGSATVRRRWRRRRNHPLTAGAVPMVFPVNDEVPDATVTREVGADIAIVQLATGKHQATRTADAPVLEA